MVSFSGTVTTDRRYAGRKKTAWIAADTAFTLMLDIAGEQNGHTEDVSGKAEIVAGVIGKIMDLSSAG